MPTTVDSSEDAESLEGLEGRAGSVLVRVAVASGLWVIGVSLLAAVLGGVGLWHPWLVLPLVAVLAVACGLAVRRLPVPTAGSEPGRRRQLGALPAAALVAVTVAFGVWAGATHAEQVLPRRDSASNLQAALSLARTHERVVAVDPSQVGGADVLALPGLTLASPAFYAIGGAGDPAIQPQFVIGPAGVYGLGDWLGGLRSVLVLPALAGALGLLALGLLVGRVLGGWWAPIAAAVVGLSFPILHVSRSTYSEPLSLVTLGAGLLALTIAAGSDVPQRTARQWGLVAGLLVGGTTFVRIDGLRETILLLVVAGLGLAQHRAWPRPLLVGAGASTALAFGAALWLSNQYLGSIARSLLPLLALGGLVAAFTWAGLRLARRGHALRPSYAARLPLALSVATAAGLLFLASRPLWLVVRQDAADPGARYVAGMQARQGLAVDGGRTYAEHTITWLQWWLGPVALVLAAGALVVLVHRAARVWVDGRALPDWAAVLVVATGSTLMTLWRPGITPDHPWAERRLVIAIPLVLVLALAGVRSLWHQRWRTGPSGSPRMLAGLGLLAVLAFTVKGVAPHAASRVELGELAAVDRVCAALQPDDVVLMVDGRAANEWTQVVRGQCGRASLTTTAAARKDPLGLTDTISRVDSGVRASGGRLVLLSADDTPPALSVGEWRDVVDVTVLESEHALEHRPDRLDPLPIRVRLATP